MFMEVFGEFAAVMAFIAIPLAISTLQQDRQERKEQQRRAAAHRAYVADLFRQIG